MRFPLNYYIIINGNFTHCCYSFQGILSYINELIINCKFSLCALNCATDPKFVLEKTRSYNCPTFEFNTFFLKLSRAFFPEFLAQQNFSFNQQSDVKL